MVKLEWSETAILDIKDIFDYIAKDSSYYARSFIKRIQKETKLIKSLPHAGRVVPEFKDDNLREIIFQNYRIIYKTDKNSVTILTIFHSARNLDSKNL